MIRIMVLMYLACWFSFIIGYLFIRSGSRSARKLEKFVWNSRIRKFQIQPFREILRLYEQKIFLLLFLLVIGINFTMVIFQAIAGLILIAPVIVLYQGFFVGLLIAQADRKTALFSLFVLIFELGAFSTAGAIGLSTGIDWIFMKVSFTDSIKNVIAQGNYFIPIICLFLNGLFEASGVFLGIEGVPGVKAVKEQLFK
ncbi:MAG TPA: hypothetical protein ENN63_01885 [Bacteroidetes bacterium]|nr:hypothetical protein [Bacteroidota bacterium]